MSDWHPYRDQADIGIDVPQSQRLCKFERVWSPYLTRVLRMTLLAPDIIEAILDGRQGDGIDLTTLANPAPHTDSLLAFGRILWGEANEYPQEILLREGAKPAGLFHLRIT